MEGFAASWSELPAFSNSWQLLSPMEEGQVVETAPPAAQPKPKRQRAKKENTALKGDGIKCAGKWIVCQYCGNTSEKALVPSSLIKGVAFDTFPCGLAWIKAHSDDGLVSAALCEGLCKVYGQPPNQALAAPATTGLIQFGGSLTADQWLPNSELWRQLTQREGVNFDGLPSNKGKSTKKAAGAQTAVVLEVGVYVIPLKGAPKRVEAIDGKPKVQGEVTYAEAVRKIRKWAKANDGYNVQHYDHDNHSVTACHSQAPLLEHLNNTATQLVGTSVYGPALAVLTRKVSVKV
jgi:hypothetical protein